jgi:hypothetical protein
VDTSPLTGWDNFYVIAGSSAAGLTGLTFIVITLAAEARRVNPNGLRIFITPTIVHFSAVLGAAAFLSMPRQSVLSVSWGCGLAGAAGILYAAAIGAGVRRIATAYVPVREDWIWNVILPAAAYGCLLAVAFLIWRWPVGSLYGVAAALVLLLFVGIHNAWDIAVWNSLRKPDEPGSKQDEPSTNL